MELRFNSKDGYMDGNGNMYFYVLLPYRIKRDGLKDYFNKFDILVDGDVGYVISGVEMRMNNVEYLLKGDFITLRVRKV
jgi:hypothetical protein